MILIVSDWWLQGAQVNGYAADAPGSSVQSMVSYLALLCFQI